MTQESNFYQGVGVETIDGEVNVTFDGLSFAFKPGMDAPIQKFKAQTTQGRIDELICVFRHLRRSEYPDLKFPANAPEIADHIRELPEETLCAIKRELTKFNATEKRWVN